MYCKAVMKNLRTLLLLIYLIALVKALKITLIIRKVQIICTESQSKWVPVLSHKVTLSILTEIRHFEPYNDLNRNINVILHTG